MKSLSRLGDRSVALPLSADEIVEFHAARLLLLISLCGVRGRMDGLTKLAKLDFFVRYPDFFEVARKAIAQDRKRVTEARNQETGIDDGARKARGSVKVKKRSGVAVATETVDSLTSRDISTDSDREVVESAMIRHHYGPWDKRYYHVLSYLEAKELIEVSKMKKQVRIALTAHGRDLAERLARHDSFAPLATRMKDVKSVFRSMTGTALKKLVYGLFDAEVAQREMGEVIQR